MWAAVEGVGGLDPSGDGVTLKPQLANDWKWMGLQNLPYRGKRLTYFAARTPALMLYANFHPQQSDPYQAYDDDISDHVKAGLDAVVTLGLRSGDNMILFAGNTSEQTVNTSLRVGVPLSGAYRARVYESLLGEWADHGLLPADQLMRGHILKIERKGFSLVELRQEV